VLRRLIARLFRLPSPDAYDRLLVENERLALDLRNERAVATRAETHRREMTRALVELRVKQSALSRAGWEVMCFIPEEVLEKLRADGAKNPYRTRIVKRITAELVRLAIDGIVRVTSDGKVCALVFAPLDTRFAPAAPEYVQALHDNQGTFKLSEKAWDTRNEEQRVKSAAGCGGFGV